MISPNGPRVVKLYHGNPFRRVTLFIGDGVTLAVSRPASLPVLVLVSTVALLLATSGCIEVKDPPPAGKFIIDVESEGIFFVPASGGLLEGPHAHVETDLHHEHPDYSWDIDGVGEFEGAEVDVPATSVAVRKASYNLDYYEQSQHMPMLVTTLPDLTGIYFVVGNGTQLDENLTMDYELEVEMGPSLIEHHVDEMGAVMEFSGRLSDGIALNISLNGSAPNETSYVLGITLYSGELDEEVGGSVAIYPGEMHRLFYVDGELNVTIYPMDDPTNITFQGTFEDLPSEYHTDIGDLLWVGRVGEEEEAPGMASWTALMALGVVALVAVGRRRR